MVSQIIEAFIKCNLKGKTGNKFVFEPEIKVKIEKGHIYISELRVSAITAVAKVEVVGNRSKDVAIIPVNNLSEVAQNAILIRLKI